VGFLAAASPDLDFIISLLSDDPMTYLNHHRGVTHSVLLLPIWAGLLSGIFNLLFRSLPLRQLYAISALSLALHIAFDVITSYGTMIFAPLSNWRVALDTTFIIDPIFSGIIVLGLLSAAWSKTRHLMPKLASVTLLCYIGVQAWANGQAEAIGTAWAKQHGLSAEVHALPQPLSPFHWRLVVIDPDHYHMSYLKLFGESVATRPEGGFLNQIAQIYRPRDQLHWNQFERPDSHRLSDADIGQAWRDPVMADYRAFARYPVSTQTSNNPDQCTWFSDLQFQLPGRNNPFVFGLCHRPELGTTFLARLR
jgi:inner membrane protein